ncbi:MAG: hypothetical protein ACRDNK_13515, partial [Solirubrobacteraceae bacterium]
LNETGRQLEKLGLGRGVVQHRLRTGRLVRVHHNVYSLGAPRREPIARAAAAVLAGGPGAVLSHESAAALWGLRKRWPDPPEITVMTDRRPSGIGVHTSKTLTARLPSHPGTKRVRGLASTATAAPARSDFETDFPAFAREHGLPEPQINAHVAGYEVDAPPGNG